MLQHRKYNFSNVQPPCKTIFEKENSSNFGDFFHLFAIFSSSRGIFGKKYKSMRSCSMSKWDETLLSPSPAVYLISFRMTYLCLDHPCQREGQLIPQYYYLSTKTCKQGCGTDDYTTLLQCITANLLIDQINILYLLLHEIICLGDDENFLVGMHFGGVTYLLALSISIGNGVTFQ